MDVKWTSRCGNERSQNNDAIALGYKGGFLIAVLVDAAESRVTRRVTSSTPGQKKRLAVFWADSCLKRILQLEGSYSDEAIINMLSDQQKQLRSLYLHDIASYGILILNLETGDVQWLYTGDCRIGLVTYSGEVQWLNRPHRLNEFPLLIPQGQGGQDINPSARDISEHTLTQCLNARRFTRPDLVTSKIDIKDPELAAASIVIGTDGYWSEHLQEGVEMSKLVDDASYLTIKCGRSALKMQSDSPNLFVIYA